MKLASIGAMLDDGLNAAAAKTAQLDEAAVKIRENLAAGMSGVMAKLKGEAKNESEECLF